MEAPSLIIAFVAGLLSFLSPCVLPLVPAYIAYLGGSVVRTGPGSAAQPRRKAPVAVGETARVTSSPEGAPIPATAASVAVATAGTGAATMSGGSGGAGVAVEREVAAPRPASAARPKQAAASRWIVLTHAFVFVLGFTLVFAIIGGLLGSARELLLTENPIFGVSNRRILQYIVGVLLIVFGLHMIGLINIPWLNYERRLGDKIKPGPNLSYVRSFVIGLGFGLGWTPCIGPTLALIFGLAMNGEQGEAVLPFLAYSIGLGVPFMLTALAMGSISKGLKRLTRYSYTLKVGNWTAIDRVNVVSLISGGLLIVMGLLIFSNLLSVLAPALPGIGNL